MDKADEEKQDEAHHRRRKGGEGSGGREMESGVIQSWLGLLWWPLIGWLGLRLFFTMLPLNINRKLRGTLAVGLLLGFFGRLILALQKLDDSFPDYRQRLRRKLKAILPSSLFNWLDTRIHMCLLCHTLSLWGAIDCFQAFNRAAAKDKDIETFWALSLLWYTILHPACMCFDRRPSPRPFIYSAATKALKSILLAQLACDGDSMSPQELLWHWEILHVCLGWDPPVNEPQFLANIIRLIEDSRTPLDLRCRALGGLDKGDLSSQPRIQSLCKSFLLNEKTPKELVGSALEVLGSRLFDMEPDADGAISEARAIGQILTEAIGLHFLDPSRHWSLRQVSILEMVMELVGLGVELESVPGLLQALLLPIWRDSHDMETVCSILWHHLHNPAPSPGLVQKLVGAGALACLDRGLRYGDTHGRVIWKKDLFSGVSSIPRLLHLLVLGKEGPNQVLQLSPQTRQQHLRLLTVLGTLPLLRKIWELCREEIQDPFAIESYNLVVGELEAASAELGPEETDPITLDLRSWPPGSFSGDLDPLTHRPFPK